VIFMEYQYDTEILAFAFTIILIYICVYFNIFGMKTWTGKKLFDNGTYIPNLRTFVINLDKDVTRYNNMAKSYRMCDIKHNKLERYSAIVGADINANKWLSPSAMNELQSVLKNGHRTHHYQLTYGGIGCFISHYYLAKQLIRDSSVDTYLVMEDDVYVIPMVHDKLNTIMMHAPADWDFIYLYYHRLQGEHVNAYFKRVRGSWGLGMYMINKKGATKFVNEVDNYMIDGQVDAYLSRMSQQGKLNIYASKIHLCKNVGRDTNIQNALIPIKGQNPFNYNGYIV
jgi:GR25 family glycosyltransferase involved in LPS biosynthesis